jgi:1-phosphofructokinase family hexose kinase
VIVSVAANPSIDKLFAIARLVPGGIHRPSEFLQVAGGKGLNVARAVTCLGAAARGVALVGGHAGAWIEEALAEEGIDATFARGSHETRSCLSVAAEDRGGLTEFYEDGPPVEPAAWEGLEVLVENAVSGAGWLTLSGSIPAGAPQNGYARLIERARSVGVRVAVDTRGAFLRAAIDARPDVVKVNAAEAGELLGREVATTEECVRAAREMRERLGDGRSAAIVTRGGDGAVAVDDEEGAVVATLDARGRFPVGSGDAFLAGLVLTLESGDDLASALPTALGAGAANAEVPGAGRLDAERARALSTRARVARV